MWRVVISGGVSHYHPSTNHNLPHKQVVPFGVTPDFFLLDIWTSFLGPSLSTVTHNQEAKFTSPIIHLTETKQNELHIFKQ